MQGEVQRIGHMKMNIVFMVVDLVIRETQQNKPVIIMNACSEGRLCFADSSHNEEQSRLFTAAVH